MQFVQNKNKLFCTVHIDDRGHGGRWKDKVAALFSCCVGVLCVQEYRFVFPLKRCSIISPFAFVLPFISLPRSLLSCWLTPSTLGALFCWKASPNGLRV